jgi:chemotaxis signal transduction protein
MAEAEARPVRALLVPLQGGRMLLLPNAAVAEVVALRSLDPAPDGAPAWQLGTQAWRGQALPVVSYEALRDEPASPPGRGAQLIVLNAVGPAAADGAYFGLAAAGIPHLMIVREGMAQTVAAPGEGGFALCDMALGDSRATIPDLEAIESSLAGLG